MEGYNSDNKLLKLDIKKDGYMKNYNISHLVKSEDLNHHGTLFAGRSTEWLVEAASIAAAAEHGRPQDVLCVNVHGFTFKNLYKREKYLLLHSRIARVGNTSITVHVKAVFKYKRPAM